MAYLDEAPQRVLDRIADRIEHGTGGCWLFRGALSAGYGRVSWAPEPGAMVWGSVHRIVYTDRRGAIPEGMDLDHLCHDPKTCSGGATCPHRACCNPDHLEPVTRRVNLLRGGGKAAERAAVTHCPAGHEYTDANTSIDKLGRRNCRECVRARNRAYYHRNVERRAAYNRQWRATRRASSPDSP